jgi:nucleoside-diphosphate-sugar epimerase
MANARSSSGSRTTSTVVVTGASGNIGTAVLRQLLTDDRVGDVRAVARRPPRNIEASGLRWFAADVAADDLGPIVDGADAVIHLAWQIQPSWDPEQMRRTNIDGSARVFEAAAQAQAAIIHASSIGAYGPGPKDAPVDERWPTTGHRHHPYSEHKAAVEEVLDRVEARFPSIRVVRLRPALVLQAAAGQELRRYFLPRHLPGAVLRPGLVERAPVRFQVTHADDIAAAFVTAALGDATGAFNLGTDDIIGGKHVPMLRPVLRAVADVSWRLHLQPVDPGWVDLIFRSPLVDSSRARDELGWVPVHTGHEALAEGLRAMADPPDGATAALSGTTP